MREKHFYTEEEQTEIRSNPYTLYVTPYKVVFTLAFKKYVVAEHKKPGMTSRKIFLNAGYREGIFTNLMMQKRVKYILQEVASEKGLVESKIPNQRKQPQKQTAAKVAELERQVLKLQQEVEFLKKIRHLEKTGRLPPRNSS